MSKNSGDCLAEGPLSPFVYPYIHYLRERRYADGTIRAYLRGLAHFAYWGAAEGFKLQGIDGALVNRFIGAHLPNCTCPTPICRHVKTIRPALKHLIVVLQQADHSISMDSSVSTPAAHELMKFRCYLSETCGFAESTIFYRLRHIGDFLERQFGAGEIDIDSIASADIDKCVMNYAKRWRPSSLGVIRASLRSYFRFCSLRGDQTRHLIAALPVLADWSKVSLPKALNDIQLKKFVQSFDLTTPIGQRDYAIARCLIDLGLRGCDVANLTLESVDWRRGILTVENRKGRRVVQLPLPAQTGQAIANYLRHGRPVTASRALFVHHEAPIGDSLHVTGIRGAMRRAFERCGLGGQFCNTHVFRHTFAVRLQRCGSSLKEIADVLGHRSLESTMSYARVDLAGLRTVALPWPGAQS